MVGNKPENVVVWPRGWMHSHYTLENVLSSNIGAALAPGAPPAER